MRFEERGKTVTDERFEENVRRMINGEKDGLKEIYQEYMPYIYTTVLHILKSKENAEDITSDFFIKLWDKAQQYKFGGAHKGYLATIARNMAIDYIRKYKKEELTDTVGDGSSLDESNIELEGNHSSNKNAGIEKSLVEEEVISDISLTQALEILKESEREIVHMKVLGDLTFKEIAQVLQIPMGTVTWRYQNAMTKLRRCGYE